MTPWCARRPGSWNSAIISTASREHFPADNGSARHLARAVVRHPRVFLMDEPLSNLDAKLRLTMRAQLKHIQRRLETTTVYVTHDQIEAMTLADRIAIMDKGKIQQLGTPDEVYNNPANVFVAGFIGSPPMNLIKGDIENGSFSGASTRVEGVGEGSRKA
jgi:multiple sugar transport system ATP-binding protein